MRAVITAAALLALSSCSPPPARIVALQSAEGDVALGFCQPTPPRTFLVIAITGEPVWYARLALMSDDTAELRSDDQVLYGELLEGDDRSDLLERGDFNHAIRSTSRIVIACCPPVDMEGELEFSLVLKYARLTEGVADTVRASDLIQRCETPDVTPMQEID